MPLGPHPQQHLLSGWQQRQARLRPVPLHLVEPVLVDGRRSARRILLIAAKRSDQIASQLAEHDYETDQHAFARIEAVHTRLEEVAEANRKNATRRGWERFSGPTRLPVGRACRSLILQHLQESALAAWLRRQTAECIVSGTESVFRRWLARHRPAPSRPRSTGTSTSNRRTAPRTGRRPVVRTGHDGPLVPVPPPDLQLSSKIRALDPVIVVACSRRTSTPPASTPTQKSTMSWWSAPGAPDPPPRCSSPDSDTTSSCSTGQRSRATPSRPTRSPAAVSSNSAAGACSVRSSRAVPPPSAACPSTRPTV